MLGDKANNKECVCFLVCEVQGRKRAEKRGREDGKKKRKPTRGQKNALHPLSLVFSLSRSLIFSSAHGGKGKAGLLLMLLMLMLLPLLMLLLRLAIGVRPGLRSSFSDGGGVACRRGRGRGRGDERARLWLARSLRQEAEARRIPALLRRWQPDRQAAGQDPLLARSRHGR